METHRTALGSMCTQTGGKSAASTTAGIDPSQSLDQQELNSDNDIPWRPSADPDVLRSRREV